MGNGQHICIICQPLSQISSESLYILLQILNIMTTISYYKATDNIKVMTQINDNLKHLQILQTLQCHTNAKLTGLNDKENVDDFPPTEFLYSILQFTQYLTSSILDLLKGKWKWYTTRNIQETTIVYRHFRKKLFNIQSSARSCFMCTNRQLEIRKTTGISSCL
jgi:hypothetical protein